MASNPIQRRARQSFLIGFLIALVIMAIVVATLFMKINALNEEKEKMVLTDVTVYTTIEEIKSGAEVTQDMLTPITIQTVNTIFDVGNYLTPGSFEYNSETGEAYKYYSKIDIPSGSVMLANMLYAENEATTSDERIIEYNMLVLPSQLNNGDYIDIRYKLPTGVDYIVLSRKRVEQCTTDTIWMEMNEEDINVINSAIIDAYRVTGSMLYATIYKEPGMQSALTQTYPVNNDVLTEIQKTPNILQEAKNALNTRWNSQDQQNQRTNKIDIYTADDDDEQKATVVESKNQESVTTQQTMRDEYVSALEGTGQVGTGYETSN